MLNFEGSLGPGLRTGPEHRHRSQLLPGVQQQEVGWLRPQLRLVQLAIPLGTAAGFHARRAGRSHQKIEINRYKLNDVILTVYCPQCLATYARLKKHKCKTLRCQISSLSKCRIPI